MASVYENQDPNYFGNDRPSTLPENFGNLDAQGKA